MRSFANWMIVTFMAMFWGFRVFITYMATSGSDFLVKPIDTTVEIVLLFITLGDRTVTLRLLLGHSQALH